MLTNARNRLWFFVIFLAGSSVGFLVGGYSGSNFGMSLIVNGALNKNAHDVNIQLQALRRLRAGDPGAAIELLEASVDDSLISFDPAEPYPGVKEKTTAAINDTIKNARAYRSEYPRTSDRPHVDSMVQNLFKKNSLKP